MLFLLAFGLPLALATPPSGAPPSAAPTALANGERVAAEALITALYAPYLREGAKTPELREALPWAPALEAAWAKAAADPEGGQAAPGFDPFIDAQDYHLTGLRVAARREADGQLVVVASFLNFGEPQSIAYHLVGAGAAWKVADVAGRGGSLLKTLQRW